MKNIAEHQPRTSLPACGWLLGVVLILGVLLGGAPASAAGFGYRAESIPFQWFSAFSGEELQLNDNDDVDVPIGFTFPFFGEVYNTVRVSSNGFLQLGGGKATDPNATPLPLADEVNGIIAPLWDDLNPALGGRILVAREGELGHRRLIIEYNDVPFAGVGGSNTFQVVLFEGTGFIMINLSRSDASAPGRRHTIGIEDVDGVDGLLLDHSDRAFREFSWLLRRDIHPGGTVPDCGSDGVYDCFDLPFEYDTISDEVGDGAPAGYEVDRLAPVEWIDVPPESRKPLVLGDDDVRQVDMEMGFTFYGATYTSAYVGSNGLLGFGPNTGLFSRTPVWMPDNNAPNNMIAALWSDLNPSLGGQIYTGTVGVSPNRMFVVVFDRIAFQADPGATSIFQFVLHEADGGIDLNYRKVPSGFRYGAGMESALDINGVQGLTVFLDSLGQTDRTVKIRYRDAIPGQGDGQVLWEGPTEYSLEGCDDDHKGIDLPFEFKFYDDYYTRIYVGTNGLASVIHSHDCFYDDDCGVDDPTAEPIPNPTNPQGILAAGWSDHLPCAGGAVYYRVRGEAPNRQAVVEWKDLPNYWNLSRISSFQMIIHENTGAIDYFVRQLHVPEKRPHTIGIEDTSGTRGIQISHAEGELVMRAWRLTQGSFKSCDPDSLGLPCAFVGGVGQCRTGVTSCANAEVICSQYSWGTTEVCDGLDNDCDGSIDVGVGELAYEDRDQDGFGDPALGQRQCDLLPGFVRNNADCLDSNSTVNPDALEICDNLDNDCDSFRDENLERDCTTQCGEGVEYCIAGQWAGCTAPQPSLEVCDGEDNDCDGDTDESLTRTCTTACGRGTLSCIGGDWSACDAPTPRPEVCDGRDNDCDGFIDNAMDCGCQSVPSVSQMTPSLEWAWTGSMAAPTANQIISTPVVGNLTDDNGNGVVDAGDVPEVVFVSTGPDPRQGGFVRAVDGGTGVERWTFLDHRASGYSSPAIGDLNNDGSPEVVFYAWNELLAGAPSSVGLIALDSDGNELWRNNTVNRHRRLERGSPAIANIRPDIPGNEIATCFWLISATGQVLWDNYPLLHTPRGLCSPAVADIDGDGELEVVIGARAFNADGSVLWSNATLALRWDGTYDSSPAVADLDGDGRPEVIVARKELTVLDGATGQIRASLSLVGGGQGGAPTLADIDGDDLPEIGVAGANAYTLYRFRDGVLQSVWTELTQDISTSTTSSTMFDLDGDGTPEILYGDELSFRIFSGADGAVLYKEANWSGTGAEYPVVADLDGDANAEILLIRNTIGDNHLQVPDDQRTGPLSGIRALGSAGDLWANARPVWNQYSFHHTNVTDGASIPVFEAKNWESWTTHSYRSNWQANAGAFLAPDLTVRSRGQLQQGAAAGNHPDTGVPLCAAYNRLPVEVCNQGDIRVGPGITVNLVVDNDFLVATHTTTRGMEPDGCLQFDFEWVSNIDGNHILTMIVDAENLHSECSEDNNRRDYGGATFLAPRTETCDNLDNDCDGAIDQGVIQICDNSCGGGAQVCTAGVWGECDGDVPLPEQCDGVDNDCDGTVDEVAEACGDGAEACLCENGNCECVFVLSVENECGVGCPLGTVCGPEATCVPWCVDDHACPAGQVCAEDHTCQAAPAALDEPATPAPVPAQAGCQSLPGGGPAPGGLGLLLLMGALVALRRRR